MKKILLYTALVLILILLFSTCIVNGYGNTVNPELPQWQVGNWWKFNIEISGEVNLTGTYTFTVVSDDVDVFQNEQTFNCYQISASGEGTLSGDIDGNEVEGTWTTTEQQYYTKLDQNWVAVYSTYEETFSVSDDSGVTKIFLVQDQTITSTITVETTYNPPFEANKGYPLAVGKSWSATTNETTKKQTSINLNVESTTESESYTKTFSVLRKESTALPTGETETYVIKRIDPDGAYAETYYSPKIGFDAKQIEYDSSGTLQVHMELLDYAYPTTGNDLQFLISGIFQILMILTIVVVVVVALIVLLKRKRTVAQPQNSDISSLIVAS
jgi:hypothetical protein